MTYPDDLDVMDYQSGEGGYDSLLINRIHTHLCEIGYTQHPPTINELSEQLLYLFRAEIGAELRWHAGEISRQRRHRSCATYLVRRAEMWESGEDDH